MSWISIEANLYWTLFAIALLGVAVWEMYCPWRAASPQMLRRWRNHGLLVVTSSAVTALLFRASLVMVAAASAHNKFGLLNRPWMPWALRCVLTFLLIDLLSYGLHYASHSVRLFWKVHQVHHSDPDYDLSTGVRNHPLETLVAQVVTSAVIVVLAAPPVAVVGVEVVGMLSAFFTHANANLPAWIEKRLRLFLITPDMHRIHHADQLSDQNANLGEVFPWWDRLFGTYRETPSAGLEHMRVGLKGFQGPASAGFLFILTQPFRSAPAPAPELKHREESMLAQAAGGD